MRVVLDGVFNHSGRGFWPFHHVVENGIDSPYVDWFHIDKRGAAGGPRPLQPYPTREEIRRMARGPGAGHRQGEVTLPAGLPSVVGPARAAQAQHRQPGHARAPPGCRGALAALWHRRLAARRGRGDRCRVLARVPRACRAINPDAYIVAEIWREKPQWVSGDTFDGVMNYPLTEALLSFTAAGRLDMSEFQASTSTAPSVRPIDGPTFAGALEHLMTMYRPDAIRSQLNLLGSHDTPRYLTLASRDSASVRLALLATMTLPGAPCIYYGDESRHGGSARSRQSRRAFPWDHRNVGPRAAGVLSHRDCAAPRATGPAPWRFQDACR